ncbi:MAG: alkaline phosphatase D family protein [Gammaproteobacteria bacterium]|nr:alkaline phosphatase D family protein [Gammaproteobacteria bacterium]
MEKKIPLVPSQYTRRKFISTLVISASAVALGSLTGCGSSSKDSTPTTTPTTSTELQPGQQFFTQSVVSGDPKPDSVILWTRVEESVGDITLKLQLALDPEFSDIRVDQSVDALADYDHCVKVRITELTAYSHYYYRFIYTKDGVDYVSNTGRTKTAPLPDADQNVKFAFVNCQDYIGRYYNNYLSLLANDDIDFVVHLGDYVYETTGDPRFQTVGGRGFMFDDQAGAQALGTGVNTFYAAKSLNNYRQLYKTYRGDKLLQEVHEQFPMIAIWDDHEFADDSWQDNSTALNGAISEQDTKRKQDAERAYFEYMPLDHEAAFDKDSNQATNQLTINEQQLYPNTTIYRDFKFGQHLHLIMSDFRTHRPDHLIPEDAFPATIVMDQATTAMVIAQAKNIPINHATAFVQATFMPYIDIDQAQHHVVKTFLIDIVASLYQTEYQTKLGLTAAKALVKAQEKSALVMQGKLTIDYLNRVIEQVPQSLLNVYNISPFSSDNLERGIAYFTLGKTAVFSEMGSRYMVIKDVFDLYAGYKALQDPQSQNAYGNKQALWLGQTMAQSSATWKVLGSSVSFTPLIFDLSSDRVSTNIAPLEAMLDSDAVPSLFKQRFYVNVDHWDGFPQGKAQFINQLSQAGVISISGDIHSSYVTEHQEVAGNRSFGFTASSISSATMGSFIEDALQGLASSVAPESAATFKQLSQFFNVLTQTASQRDDVATNIAMSELWQHGLGIVNVSGDEFKVTLHQVPATGDVEYIKQSYYDDRSTFLAAVSQSSYLVKNGTLSKI